MPDSTGPVQLLAVAFGAGTRFEGQIAEELDRLEPGTSAAFMAFEHVWARGLKQAIGDVGGVPFAEGFLTAEAVAAMQA